LCEYFYTRTFEFEINYDTFDVFDIIDHGTLALGYWDPEADPETGDHEWIVPAGLSEDEPGDFNRYRDKTGEIASVFLDGHGEPLSGTATPVPIPMITDKGAVKYYRDTFTFGGVTYPVDYVHFLGIPEWF
jgi:hypothetical protein